jgi:hypothetical protein
MGINVGHFKGDTYTKYVSFNKAVLWKTREISLAPPIARRIKKEGISKIEFIDQKKGEKWVASYEDLKSVATLKSEGQEEQFYFPIDVFDKVTI